MNWKQGARGATLALACVLVSGGASAAAFGQVVKAPRYTGGVEAPVRQLNLPTPPPAITPNGVVVEDVVVRVNDQIVSRSDIERAETDLQQEAAERQLPPAEVAVREKNLLRDTIDQQLLLSRAKELAYNVDNEVIRQLDDLRKQNNLPSMDELEKAARQQGVNFEDLKAKYRNQFLMQQVIREEVGRRLQLTSGEEEKYYQAHLSDFQQPEQVKLSEILVPLPESATPGEIVQAERKANQLKTEIMKGGDFAAIAKKSSGGPTAAQGGELGAFKRGALAKVLEDQTFDLKAGESTQPIRTRQGFVILKVNDHNAAGPTPMKDVEPQIQEAIYTEALQPAERAYLTKLRVDAYIDIAPGFVDSGASANESKPTFSAYAPPPVKKKKEPVEKARFDRHGGYSTAPAKTVVAGPDTTGGRTLTGKDAQVPIDSSTGLAVITAPKTNRKGDVQTKREKVRFGQAPRNSLPSAGDNIAEVNTAQGPTPGAALSSAGSSTLGTLSEPAQSADLADNPLNARAPDAKKTRFASRAKEFEAKKEKVESVKKVEKAKAVAAPAGAEEKTSDAVQAAPFGLDGDTSKKPAKPAKDKDAPKTRLEDKKKVEPTQPAAIDPTANPVLAPTQTAPSEPKREKAQPDTALPPVTPTPTPGSPQPAGQPLPPPS